MRSKIVLPTLEELIVEYDCEEAVKTGLFNHLQEECEDEWLLYAASVWRMEEWKQGISQR